MYTLELVARIVEKNKEQKDRLQQGKQGHCYLGL